MYLDGSAEAITKENFAYESAPRYGNLSELYNSVQNSLRGSEVVYENPTDVNYIVPFEGVDDTHVLSVLADGSFKIENNEREAHGLLVNEDDSEAKYANQEGCGRSRSDSTTSSRLSFC